MPVRRFPNPPRLLANLLVQAGLIAAGRVGTDTPATMDSTTLPFIRIRRVGGGDDGISDLPVVDVEVFHSTAATGESLAEAVRQWLTAGAVPYSTLGVIDRVEVLTGPQELPWTDARIRRFGATYRLTARRFTSAD